MFKALQLVLAFSSLRITALDSSYVSLTFSQTLEISSLKVPRKPKISFISLGTIYIFYVCTCTCVHVYMYVHPYFWSNLLCCAHGCSFFFLHTVSPNRLKPRNYIYPKDKICHGLRKQTQPQSVFV